MRNDSVVPTQSGKQLILLLILSSLLLGWVVGYAQTPEKPAGNQIDEYLQKSEDEILAETAKLPDEQIDLGLVALVLAKGYYPDVDIKKYLNQLEDMAEELKREIGAEKNPEKTVQIMNHYLFETKGLFASTLFGESRRPASYYLLNCLLDKMKGGSSLDVTTLYLALAERLEIPLYGVDLPGYVFIRYDNGTFQRNIEPMEKGKEISKENYMRWLKERYSKNFAEVKKAIIDWKTKKRYYSTHGNHRQMTPADLDKGGYYVNLSKKDIIVYILVNRGMAYVDEHKKKAAENDAKKAVALCPTSPHLWSMIGELYDKVGDRNSALKHMNKAIELAPDFFLFYEARGYIYVSSKKLDKALADYSTAIELNPNCAKTYYGRGVVYDRMKEFDMALKDFNRAIELDPADYQPHFAQAVILFRQKEYDKSLASLQKVIELEPLYPQTYYTRGIIYKETERFPGAIKEFKKYIKLASDSPKTEKAKKYVEELRERLNTPEYKKRIKELIAQLGHEEWLKREEATKELFDIGEPALSFLEDASKNASDPEIRMRADTLIRKLSTQWGIRLLHYKNDTRGRYMAQRMITWLKEHNVTNVFTRQEYFGETDQICVYVGPYTSRQEAEKDLPPLRAKHRAFKNCNVREVK